MAKIATDSQHYTNIANIIREKTHTTATYKPEEMVSGIEKVYEQGFQDGGAGQGGGSTNTPTITKVIAGNPVTLMDVSDIPHNISLQLTSDMITDFSNVYVKVNGKNLVNLNEAIIGKTLSGGGVGKIIAGVTAASGAIIPYIRVQPNTTYTFSLDNSVYWLNRICQMDKNNNCTENHSFYTNTANDYSEYSIYTRSDTTWVALGLVKKSDNQIAALDELQAINLQFERKSYASNFEPYWEEIYQVNELGKNDVIKSHFNDLNISIVDTVSTSGQIQCQQQDILISAEYHQLYGTIIERENFWRAFQQGGARVDYSNAFKRYSADMFYPYYDIIPTNINHGFHVAQIGNLKKILQDNNVILDTSKATDVDSAFRSSTISHLPVIDFTNATRATYSFYYCEHLHTIDKLILSDKITAFDNMLTGCGKLQNIEIEGLIAGKNFNTNHSLLLSKESIISIINALSPTTTGLTIVFSQYAVTSAFGVDDEGNLSQEWYDLIEPKQQNWTISLV